MKYIVFFIFFLFAAHLSKAQNVWIGQSFKSNVLIGDKGYSTKHQTIYLTQLDERDPWGNYVQFHDDGTFDAYNQVKCGQDCRMKIKGTYTVKDGIIEMTVNEKKYYDACATRPSRTKTFTYGTFEILEKGEGFVLKQV